MTEILLTGTLNHNSSKRRIFGIIMYTVCPMYVLQNRQLQMIICAMSTGNLLQRGLHQRNMTLALYLDIKHLKQNHETCLLWRQTGIWFLFVMGHYLLDNAYYGFFLVWYMEEFNSVH